MRGSKGAKRLSSSRESFALSNDFTSFQCLRVRASPTTSRPFSPPGHHGSPAPGRGMNAAPGRAVAEGSVIRRGRAESGEVWRTEPRARYIARAKRSPGGLKGRGAVAWAETGPIRATKERGYPAQGASSGRSAPPTFSNFAAKPRSAPRAFDVFAVVLMTYTERAEGFRSVAVSSHLTSSNPTKRYLYTLYRSLDSGLRKSVACGRTRQRSTERPAPSGRARRGGTGESSPSRAAGPGSRAPSRPRAAKSQP